VWQLVWREKSESWPLHSFKQRMHDAMMKKGNKSKLDEAKGKAKAKQAEAAKQQQKLLETKVEQLQIEVQIDDDETITLTLPTTGCRCWCQTHQMLEAWHISIVQGEYRLGQDHTSIFRADLLDSLLIRTFPPQEQ
jgi:hypothetical protein